MATPPKARKATGSGQQAAKTGGSQQAGRAIREASLETVAEGLRTADLGGHASTTEFTDEVIHRVKTKIDVWSALADIDR